MTKQRFEEVLNCTKCGDYAIILGKCISTRSGKICGGMPIRKIKDNYIPFENWGAREYDLAVDSIADNIYLTQEQRGRIRLAIRNEVEKNDTN